MKAKRVALLLIGSFGSAGQVDFRWLGLLAITLIANALPESWAAEVVPEPEQVEGSLVVKTAISKRPWGVCFDGKGFMYLAGNNFEIDRVSPAGQVKHFGNIAPTKQGVLRILNAHLL